MAGTVALDAGGLVIALDVFREAVATTFFGRWRERLDVDGRCGDATRQGNDSRDGSTSCGCAEKETPPRGLCLAVWHLVLQGLDGYETVCIPLYARGTVATSAKSK